MQTQIGHAIVSSHSQEFTIKCMRFRISLKNSDSASIIMFILTVKSFLPPSKLPIRKVLLMLKICSVFSYYHFFKTVTVCLQHLSENFCHDNHRSQWMSWLLHFSSHTRTKFSHDDRYPQISWIEPNCSKLDLSSFECKINSRSGFDLVISSLTARSKENLLKNENSYQ